jgi:hypothetical protein
MLTPHDISSILENHDERSAPVRQDKEALPRFSAASPQASTATKPALNDRTNATSSTSHIHKHSTKRQKIFAGSWVSRETDAYIEHRLQEGRKGDPNLSRSAVIRMMLEERALDATIASQHAILAPLIRETMHQEFQAFTNRLLGPISRIAYEVSRIMPFLIGCFANFIKEQSLHRIEEESETAARVNVTRRTPQVDEVLRKLQARVEETN